MRWKQTVRQLKEGKTWPRKHLIRPWIPHKNIKHTLLRCSTNLRWVWPQVTNVWDSPFHSSIEPGRLAQESISAILTWLSWSSGSVWHGTPQVTPSPGAWIPSVPKPLSPRTTNPPHADIFLFCLFSLRRKRASTAPTSVTRLPTSQYASKQWGALGLVVVSHKQEAEEQLNTIIQYYVWCYNVLLCFISF